MSARAGHQHKLEQGAWPDGLERSLSRSPARCWRSIRASRDINMGRGAIVIGLAAVIIGEVVFGKIFTQLRRSRCWPLSIGAIIYYIVLQIVLLARSEHQRLEAHHGADRGGLPRHPLLEEQDVPPQGAAPERKERRQWPCLNSRNFIRPSTPAPSTPRRALNGLSSDAERRRLRHRHRRQRRGQVHDAQRHRRHVLWSTSGKIIIDGSDVTNLPEHKRAAFIGRVFQDPMMGTAAHDVDRGEPRPRRPPRPAPRSCAGA